MPAAPIKIADERTLEGQLGPDQAQLLDAFPPPLEAGTYDVDLRQSVALGAVDGPASAGDPPGPQAIELARAAPLRFHVSAPQLRLAAELVHSAYPADGRTGAFAATLPHVVLARRTLPWERDLDPTLPAGAGTPPLRAPWMALLVLHEADATGGRFRLRTDLPVATLVAGEPDVTGPALSADDVDPAEQAADGGEPAPIAVVDIDRALFAAIAPSVAELPLLAHVRHVHPDDRARATGTRDGWFATVVGNRFPESGQNTVCLVALEGHADHLPGGAAPPTTAWVRLVVLHRFTFTLDPALDPHDHPGLDLQSILTAIDSGPLALRPTDLPAGADVGVVAGRILDGGYAVLAHTTRLGDLVPSLYRGPLLPTRRVRITFPPPAHPAQMRTIPIDVADSDRLLKLDPALGFYDVSFAAAFQLGRLAALADRAFAAEVVAYRRARHARFHQLAVRPEASVRDEPLAHLAGALRHWLGDGPPPAATTGHPTRSDGNGLVAALLAAAQATAGAAAELAAELGRREVLIERLAAWSRLEGLPFHYLVPDARALPPHSLRVFETDPDWVAALLIGALSLGRATGRDVGGDAALVGALLDDERLALARVEATGVLVRSRELAGWPGLAVLGFATGSGTPFEVHRNVRLSDEVRLTIFRGNAGRVELRQPIEAIHFGARFVAAAGAAGGGSYQTTGASPREVPVRAPAEARVIDVGRFGGELRPAQLAAELLDQAIYALYPVVDTDRPA